MVNYTLISLNKSHSQSKPSDSNFKTNHVFHLHNPNSHIVRNKGVTFFSNLLISAKDIKFQKYMSMQD